MYMCYLLVQNRKKNLSVGLFLEAVSPTLPELLFTGCAAAHLCTVTVQKAKNLTLCYGTDTAILTETYWGRKANSSL